MSSKKLKYYDDFYTYINYDWLQTAKIPEDETRYTHFMEVQNRINDQLVDLIKKSSLLSKLYSSYLNKSYRNSKTINELKYIITILDKVKTADDVINCATKLLFINVQSIFEINVGANIYSSCNNITYIGQPKLGLPNAEYYNELKFSNIRQSYYDTLFQTYKYLYPEYSDNKLNTIVSTILDIEKKLSIIMMKPSEKRDSDTIFNLMSLDESIVKYPKLNIKTIIRALCQLSEDDNNRSVSKHNFDKIIFECIDNDERNYFKQLELLLDSYSVDQWKEFLRFKIILKFMNVTDQKLKDLYFNMFNRTLRGQTKPKEAWKTALYYTTGLLPEPVSRLYTSKYYDKKIEKYMLDMVRNMKKATKERILKLDWMTDKTKEKALVKLHKMKLKLNYSTTKSKDYSHIVLTESVLKNTLILNLDNFQYQLNQLNNNVDFNEWDIPSFSVNAYYDPTKNEIIFPTSILQAPFLDLTKSDIYNYANIGSIIGHEIIHGFDDQGSKYDENGNVKNWWSYEDKQKFDSKVKKIIKIYDAHGVNGKLTAGENIADFGSVTIPLYALKYKLSNITKNDIKQFYIHYAEHWQYLMTEEAKEERRLTDPHAFGHLRVNVPLSHQTLFHRIFDIGPLHKMYIPTEERLSIW